MFWKKNISTRIPGANRSLASAIFINWLVANRLDSARLWVINLSDGEYSLLGIANRSGVSFSTISDAADLLIEAGLLIRLPKPTLVETLSFIVSRAVE